MNNAVLAIELSTPTATLSLSRGKNIVLEKQWMTDRDHTELFAHLKEAIDNLGDGILDAILVGAGPGSYGGIRVALAAADGIALVRQCHVVSICSWEALFPPSGKPSSVIANARRNGWVTGTIMGGKLEGDLEIIAEADMPLWLEERASREEPVYSTETQETLQKQGFSTVTGGTRPNASLLIESWLNRSGEERDSLTKIPPAPIYVRPPHITAAKTPPWLLRTKF